MTPAAFSLLSPAEVTKLLSGGTSKPRRFMIVKSATGVLETVKLVPADVGSFEGRVGTTARSRKGRTYRMPNGTRRYIGGNPDVVAYRA